jgi:hypothetical protein
MANSTATTEFRLVGPEYDGALGLLAKSFPRRMINIVIQEAVKTHGAKNTLIPTDVHFMPVYFDSLDGLKGDSFFAVRAWHETQAPEGRAGVLQPYVGNFEIVVDDTDAYLRNCQEDENSTHYKLTTAEVLGLLSLANVAADHDAVASYVDQESI